MKKTPTLITVSKGSIVRFSKNDKEKYIKYYMSLTRRTRKICAERKTTKRISPLGCRGVEVSIGISHLLKFDKGQSTVEVVNRDRKIVTTLLEEE